MANFYGQYIGFGSGGGAPAPYNIDYLVIAGGGGGGCVISGAQEGGGGGGSGGY